MIMLSGLFANMVLEQNKLMWNVTRVYQKSMIEQNFTTFHQLYDLG